MVRAARTPLALYWRGLSFRLPRPPFFRCRGGRAWHSFPRVRGNEWSEREDWRKHAFGMFSSSLRSDRPSAAPKALSGFCRTSDLVLAEEIGRRERIRTSGPYVPNVVLYQAELLSEPVRRDTPRLGRRPYNDAPRPPQPAPNALAKAAFFARLPYPRLALYGAAPGRCPATLGRRQVVRHWILIPAFGGSIPPAPANQSMDRGAFPKLENHLR